MSIDVEIRYFAAVRESLGHSAEQMSVEPDETVGGLFERLAQRHPLLDRWRAHLRLAVNLEFVGPEHPLQHGDVVALIPPVAGGVDLVRVTRDALDPVALAEWVRTDACGAVVTFTGVVRDHNQGKTVSYLEYEAYEEMALAKLRAIVAEIEAGWPDCRVAVVHRVGRLEVGDAAIVIAVAAPHRKPAFRACEHMIDRIKEDVPIFKREVGPDGQEWVGWGS